MNLNTQKLISLMRKWNRIYTNEFEYWYMEIDIAVLTIAQICAKLNWQTANLVDDSFNLAGKTYIGLYIMVGILDYIPLFNIQKSSYGPLYKVYAIMIINNKYIGLYINEHKGKKAFGYIHCLNLPIM